MSSIAKALVVVSALGAFSLPARAQSTDEWSGFRPPPPPPGATTAPAPADKPSTPAPASSDKSGYVPPPTVPVQTPTAPAATKDASATPAPAGATMIKETVLPGTEPYSPGTAGNALTALDNSRVTSGAGGATGLLRLGSADLGRPGVLRISVLGEYFTQADFPVLNARNTRSSGTLALDYTILKYVEAYLSYAASANTNNRASPPLMQAQGDIRLGVKGSLEAFKGFKIGADVTGIAFPGIGAQEVRDYAFGVAPKLLVSFDARRYSAKVPLRLHVNLGVIIDSTGELISSSHTTTPAEEFALGLNKYNRLSFGAGIEVPLPWVTPFVEYGFGYPLGTENLVGPDLKAVSATESMPQVLGIGLKLTAVKDFTLTAACEIGLARYVAMGIPATPPYNIGIGFAYAFDPLAKGTSKMVEKTVTVEKKVEVATAAPVYTGRVGGQVLDAETKQPIAGAVVAMSGTGLPPVASDVDGGKFLSHELPAGKVALTFARDGYRPAAMEAAVEAGKLTPLQAFLVREVKLATIKVSLVSGKQKAGGKVTLAGPKSAEVSVAPGELGAIDLPKGHYTATVDAEGFLSKIQEFDVPETGHVTLSIELALKPKKSLVVIKEDRIQIKQQVHFATAKATILNDSFQLLDQVVDAIVRSGTKKLRVEGHTDNQGPKDSNLKLSQARAQAVMDYLIKKGVDRSRLLSEGYGDTKPVAPNLTARGRELNRRVEFMIVER
ncbi:MAG: OmpA family protein [Deltaproteobacteria bacterium]|nr:OmpA family protein [Deltaproteobacteria bacterium]